jgi:predicted nuclease of predicted toxin-antitoxin system
MNQGSGDKSPKLLLDEHIWAYLAKILREQGFDVIHVNEVNLVASPDDKIMAYAAGEQRAVVV